VELLVLYESHHIVVMRLRQAGIEMVVSELQSVAKYFVAFLPNWDSDLHPTHKRL
jgi:hypothetical protein